MGEASKHVNLAAFLEIPIKKDEGQRSATTRLAHQSHAITTSPVRRPSPVHNGSMLYDSFEFRAMTQQLNRAIQGSKATSPLYRYWPYCFNSPLYKEGLDQIHQVSGKPPPKRIVCTPVSCATTCNRKLSNGPTKGFVSRAWNKVKQGLVKHKQRNTEG